MRKTGKAKRWVTGAVSATAVLALTACDQLADFEMPSFLNRSADTEEGSALALDGGETETRDVEAPEVFQKQEAGLWDGRPSLGGVWVAHPDVTDPERVMIRNEDNGRFVVGALFRRERENPGPALQVSSDAAEELGMLAGSPAQLNVVALRREEAEVTPPATTDFDAPADAGTVDLGAPTDIAATPLDTSDLAAADIIGDPVETLPDAEDTGVPIGAAAATIAAAAAAAEAAAPQADVLPDPVLSTDVSPVALPETDDVFQAAPVEPISNGAAAAIDAIAGAAEVAAAESAAGLIAAGGALPAPGADGGAIIGAPLDARGPIDNTLPPPPSADIATTSLEETAAATLPAEKVAPPPPPELSPVAAPEPAPEPAPASSSALEKPFIQVGIFSLETNAEGAASRLRNDGMVASVREQASDGTTFWRVVVGPAPNAADRTAILSKVQALGFSDAYFVGN